MNIGLVDVDSHNFPCELRTNGKRWTTEEIVDECKEVIDQIVNKYADEVTENE